jgi:hypothetical protein
MLRCVPVNFRYQTEKCFQKENNELNNYNSFPYISRLHGHTKQSEDSKLLITFMDKLHLVVDLRPHKN